MKANAFFTQLLRTVALPALLLASGMALAAETPPSLDGATVVDADKVKSLMASGATLLDTRVAGEYAEAHIVGAVSVPYKEKSAKSVDFDASKDKFDLSKLPADKNASIITQCNGPECWKSYKSAVAAVKAGYKHVYWFRNGIPEWKAKGYPVE